MRTTKNMVSDRVRNIRQWSKADIAIDWTAGRPRITDAQGAREISPRLSTSEMMTWLHGFEHGLTILADQTRWASYK